MRVIIRRPHAYLFAARYKGSPIPGVVILSPDEEIEGTLSLPVEDSDRLLEIMRKAKNS